jgi:hypothetical protein
MGKNRAKRRSTLPAVEKLPEWERELLLEKSREEITRLNNAKEPRPKKKKMRRMRGNPGEK